MASADAQGGAPYLVPLSFRWDGETLLLATPAASPTGRNLRTTGRTRLGIGETRDVVLVEGTVDALTPADRTQITDAMKAYERHIGDVTWHP